MSNFKKTLLLILIVGFSLILTGCFEQECTPVIVGKSAPIYTPAPATTYKKPAPKTTYSQPAITGNVKGKTIVIDPGHGGKDPGAGEVGYSSISEKHINLAIAKNLSSLLKQKGANVVMTRNNDTFIELESRSGIAERSRADLFVSVHCDSLPAKPSATGPTIYIAENASWTSKKAALSISSSLRRWGIEPRGIRKAKYKVLVGHSRPAVLVECGYLTNWQEAKYLSSSWYQEKIAKAISEGIANLY